MFVAKDGVALCRTALSARDAKAIMRELTVKPELTIEYARPKPFKLYHQTDTHLVVPREYGVRWAAAKGLAPLAYHGRVGAPVAVEPCAGFRLDETRRQPQAVQAVLDAFVDRPFAGGLLNLHTGAGKTVVAIFLWLQLRVKALIVVHKSFLKNQWLERIRAFAPGARIGQIQGPTVDVADRDVVIATVQSLSMKEYDPAVFDDFGLSIWDECHLVNTKTFSQALRKVATRYMLGLTATRERKDKLERVFEWHVGPVLFSAHREHMAVDVRLVYTDPLETDELFNPKTQKVDRVGMISRLVLDAPRNALIVDLVAREVADGAKLLVLSERRQHLADLAELLRGRGIDDVGLYIGGMPQPELDASEARQVILGSFSMASTGLDIKGLDRLVLASPVSSVTQSAGRILRNQSERGKVIYDVVDRFSLFIGQMRQRVRCYHEEGFVVHGATARGGGRGGGRDHELDVDVDDDDGAPAALQIVDDD